MNEKSYWIVNRGEEWAVITCPHCMEWYQIPNIPGEAECYHFCPWCGESLFLKEEDRYHAR